MLELIVVIAIIAIMMGSVLGSSDNKRQKINAANSAATDFYTAIQTEFTNFQMFDGPLTMSMNKAYGDISTIGKNSNNGGIKYYPAVGGNYPFDGKIDTGETHEKGLPKDKAALYIEICAHSGSIRHVNYANEFSTLVTMKGAMGSSGNTTAQLCAVLKQEMEDRMSYKDGYYYARISYELPTGITLTKDDYRSVSVTVDWAAFSEQEITDNDSTYSFRTQNMTRDGHIVGVQARTHYINLGSTGTHLW